MKASWKDAGPGGQKPGCQFLTEILEQANSNLKEHGSQGQNYIAFNRNQ